MNRKDEIKLDNLDELDHAGLTVFSRVIADGLPGKLNQTAQRTL